MNALTEKITREHVMALCSDGDYCEKQWVECRGQSCGDWTGAWDVDFAAHIAEVTEAAVREQLQRAAFDVEHRHQIHGTECVCGKFDSHGRCRSATEHITGEVIRALDALIGQEAD